MFADKTTELLRRLDSFPADAALAFKHVIDRRYSAGAIVSHGGKTYPATPVGSAEEIPPRVHGGLAVVAIDEAHFFDTGLLDVAQDVAAQGTSVILTSLDRDSWGVPFPLAQCLSAIADEPIIRHAVCARCGATADHTQRLTPIIDGNMVGGRESYEPRCEKCWTPPPELPIAAK